MQVKGQCFLHLGEAEKERNNEKKLERAFFTTLTPSCSRAVIRRPRPARAAQGRCLSSYYLSRTIFFDFFFLQIQRDNGKDRACNANTALFLSPGRALRSLVSRHMSRMYVGLFYRPTSKRAGRQRSHEALSLSQSISSA